MKCNAIVHTGIVCRDMENTMIPFLRDFMGFKQLSSPNPNPVFDLADSIAVNVPSAVMKCCVFEVSPGYLIEVLEYIEPDSPIEKPLPQNAIGSQHIAFQVDDIQEWYEKLMAEGYHCFTEPQINGPGGIHEGIKWLYFEGPCKIVMELMEIPMGFTNFHVNFFD